MAHYSLGIEEEFFVTDIRSRNVRRTMSPAFYKACKAALGDRCTTEMLQAQIEVMTPVCDSVAAARKNVEELRKALADQAAAHGLGIVAAGTHPLAVWPEQKSTQKERYGGMLADFQMVAHRNVLCGMHVHVEVPDPSRRVELMNRLVPYLPLFLALSASSPFWQGRRTGLLAYRLSAFEELPRSGLPERFATSEQYESYVQTLVDAGVIKDSSYIWWLIRPSMRHPTLELRVADACTYVEDAISIAALFRCLVRFLVHHPEHHAALDPLDRAIAAENKWRAQRYGTAATFVDRSTRTLIPAKAAVERLIGLVRDEAEAMDCVAEIAHARVILERGSSADQQLRFYDEERARGKTRQAALRAVVDWLIKQTA